MRKDAITSMKNAAAVLLACAMMLLCFVWRSPAYASVSGSIELSCGVEHAGEHVALAGDGYTLTKVASAEVDESDSISYVTEEAFSGVDRNWAALDGAGLRAAAHEVFAHAEKHGVKPQATAYADAAGKAVFSPLEPGLYLIIRSEVAPANTEFSCDPALVSVPTTVNGVFAYTVEVTPKFEHDPDSWPGPGEDDKPADPLDQLADKVAGALGFAKTSDGMFALACAAALCAFAAVILLLWRHRAAAPTSAHAASSKRFDFSVASASDASVAAKRGEAFAADRGSDSEPHTKA
ncbi:MAG: hypothetical protein ACLTQI_09215 [Slackia sp.]